MKKTILITSLALLIGIGSFAGTADAYRGDPAVKGPNYSPERHEAMTKAFETNNYQAWAELMQNRGRVTKVINQQNFARFSEAHRLMLEGKIDEAKQIRQELGLGLKNGSGQGQGMKNR